jgi:hypothetical protein
MKFITKVTDCLVTAILYLSIGLILLYFVGSLIFDIALYFDVKSELKKELSSQEYDSLVTMHIFSPSFRFIRNGEEWEAFGVADVIHGPDVYTCKRGGNDCG